jgi:hypothetical protein
VDRISAARARLHAAKAELRSPAAELPCIQCRYFEIVCTHPAASEVAVSPITGKAKMTHLDAVKVRAEDGACGPDGELFDSRSPVGLAVVSVLSSSLGRWSLFAAAMVALDALLR